MRTVNSQKLKEWLSKNGEGAKVRLHQKSGVSLDWIAKAVTGNYPSSPRHRTRRDICEATGLAEDVLFPFTPTKGKAAS